MVISAASRRKDNTQKRPTAINFFSPASGLTYRLYRSNVTSVAPELSIESMLDKIAPNTPAATSPTKP